MTDSATVPLVEIVGTISLDDLHRELGRIVGLGAYAFTDTGVLVTLDSLPGAEWSRMREQHDAWSRTRGLPSEERSTWIGGHSVVLFWRDPEGMGAEGLEYAATQAVPAWAQGTSGDLIEGLCFHTESVSVGDVAVYAEQWTRGTWEAVFGDRASEGARLVAECNRPYVVIDPRPEGLHLSPAQARELASALVGLADLVEAGVR